MLGRVEAGKASREAGEKKTLTGEVSCEKVKVHNVCTYIHNTYIRVLYRGDPGIPPLNFFLPSPGFSPFNYYTCR